MSSILAVDAGNSITKWGVYLDGWLSQDQVYNADLSSIISIWKSLQQPTIIIVSHVSTLQIKTQLVELLSIWTVKPYWVISETERCGVSNHYRDPDQLGCDRWAALIGAWSIQNKACLVINVGTAVTIDMLSSKGDFIGGIILPGPSLMLQSLGEKTALINAEQGKFEVLPRDTMSATYSGVIHALVGAIGRMQTILLNHITEPCLLGHHIVSGGGASILLPHLNITVQHVKNLVLEGLVVMARDSANK